MATKWDDLKKRLEKFATQAANKAGDFTREAADRAEEVTKLGKIKLDIFQIKREKEKEFEKIGQTVYESLKADQLKGIANNKTIKEGAKLIDELDVKLKEKEAKYQKIKKHEAEEIGTKAKEDIKQETKPKRKTQTKKKKPKKPKKGKQSN